MVYFEEFWQTLLVRLETSQPLKTLSQHKQFEAHCCDPHIIITTGQDSIVGITKNTFEEFWELVKKIPRKKRFVNKNQRLTRFRTVSYMSALMDWVVGDQNPQ